MEKQIHPNNQAAEENLFKPLGHIIEHPSELESLNQAELLEQTEKDIKIIY